MSDVLKSSGSLLSLCPGGEATVIEIIQFQKGFVRRVSVAQLDGAMDGFTCDLFETAAAAAGSPNAELYRIGPRIVAAGAETYAQINSVMWAYHNTETSASKPLGGQSIYARITPAGTGDKNFGIRLIATPNDVDAIR